jgi:ATP-binding cassette subfamily F protein 3
MIQLKNITLRRGAKLILNNASLTIQAGEKVGLVGRNGIGKSTLFALFNGSLHEDSGDLFMPSGWQLAQVAQHMPETDETATAFVVTGDTRLVAAREQLSAAEASGDGDAIGMAHAALADAGEFDAVSRAQSLILGLGFAVNQLDNPVNSFSGGWRMRLQLARALMCPSDLLLLDEPTNHLDLDALVWLESWLSQYAGTMIVISHDREFLDAVTRVTVHIDHEMLTRYGGNYTAFEELRAQQIALQQAAFSKQQDKIAHLQKFIDRFKAKATKAKQAQSRVKALERMERIAPVLTSADFSFEFREPPALPNPMLSVRDAVFGYTTVRPEPFGSAQDRPVEGGVSTVRQAHDGPGSTRTEHVPIVQGVSRTVLPGQRIGILGANGQGKSTFVKTVARAIPLLSGKLTEGKGLTIGYFAQQELDVLRETDTPLEHMVRLALQVSPDAREQELRNFLGNFRFVGDMVGQNVGTMSGGEKARLVLAMIVWQRPNLLLLDEPTNHLDLVTREALAMALNEFEGTVMLVSHDRALLRAVCDEFWLVSNSGITPFDGDLDDYQRYLLDHAKAQREALKAANSATQTTLVDPGCTATSNPANQREQRKADAAKRQALADQLKPAKKELAQIEKQMTALQEEQAQLHERLSQTLPPGEIAEAGKRLSMVDKELAAAEERWLELTDYIEQASLNA